jgi:hypothetical protein
MPDQILLLRKELLLICIEIHHFQFAFPYHRRIEHPGYNELVATADKYATELKHLIN